LLVDGKPGLEPYRGAADFLRAALAPAGDDRPQVHVRVVRTEGLDTAALLKQKVVVLAGVDRLTPAAAAALRHFVDSGGGLLIAPSDRADAAFFNSLDWIPARLGMRVGDAAARQPVAHPRPATFSSPALRALAEEDAPPLAEADCFTYHVLHPITGAAVTARFDNGHPWAAERRQGRGQVLLLATALDAASGTLPVNPDFVPLVHEWVYHLAAAPVARADDDPERRRESDPAPLEPADAGKLSEGWPLVFETDEARLDARIFAAERGGRRELWRGLVLIALAGLCLEIYLTRRLVREASP
jgi:hypothetical protein